MKKDSQRVNQESLYDIEDVRKDTLVITPAKNEGFGQEESESHSPKYNNKKNRKCSEEIKQFINVQKVQVDPGFDKIIPSPPKPEKPTQKKKWKCPQCKRPKIDITPKQRTNIIIVIVVLAALTLISVLLGVYLGRKPEVVYVTEPTITKYEKAWEEIVRYYFNISGITYTGRVDEGRGAASIVQTSSSFQPSTHSNRRLQETTTIDFQAYDGSTPSNRRLQETTTINFQAYDGSTPSNRRLQETTTINFEPYDGSKLVGSSSQVVNTWRPYGYIDLFAQNQGVTLRGLNPENRIYYVDYEKMLSYASQSHTTTSRLLTGQTPERLLAETTEDCFALILAQETAKLQGVELERIIVKREEVWTGTMNSDTNDYTISTASTQTTTTPPTSNLTAEEKTKAAQALYDSVLKGVIEEKKLQLQDYGAIIADYFGFSFDRYVDLYVTFEKVTSLGGEIEEEKTAETNSTNSTNSTVKRPTPRRPTIIVKAYEAVYGNQPARLKEGKTISRDTFDEMLACIDYNETTRTCTIDEWLSEDPTNRISQVSRSNQGNLLTKTRFRVSIRPLPADQVVQEPYEKIDPMEMYKHVSDDNNNNEQVVNMETYTPSLPSSDTATAPQQSSTDPKPSGR